MDLATIVTEAWEGYQSFQQAHPVINSMATGEVIYTAADATSQLIRHKKIDKKKIAYTAKIAPLYGLLGHGVVKSANFIGENIYNHPFTKAVASIPIGNLCNAFFFANNQLGEKNNYSIKKLVQNYSKIIKDKTSNNNLYQRFRENFINHVPEVEYKKGVLTSLPYWLTLSTLTFACVPEHMRTPTVLGGAFVWSLLISSLSLRGREKLPEVMDLEI